MPQTVETAKTRQGFNRHLNKSVAPIERRHGAKKRILLSKLRC